MRKLKGLTLVELMVVLVVMAIIAGTVYPMYTKQVRKTRRADAKTATHALALAQERYFTLNGRYAVTLGSLDIPSALQGGESENDYYDLSLIRTDSDGDGFADIYGFQATATAKSTGPQASDDDCQTFSINHQGVKTSTDGSTATTVCWD